MSEVLRYGFRNGTLTLLHDGDWTPYGAVVARDKKIDKLTAALEQIRDSTGDAITLTSIAHAALEVK